MPNYTLRFFHDDVSSQSELLLPPPGGSRIVYVLTGTVEIGADGKTQTYLENSAWFGLDTVCLRTGDHATQLWRWELVKVPAADVGSEGMRSILKESYEVDLDPYTGYLLRCDRVDFPLGGIAYTHTHPGPGIRCLLSGELHIQVNQKDSFIRPGESWVERGPDPVLAMAPETERTTFVRGMILPRSFEGRSSIQYVRAEDTDKPKRQQYTRFVDAFVELPR